MNRLKEARMKKGISQLELYKESGVIPPRISNIECGHWIPSEEEKVKLANTLGVERDWLFPKN